MTREPVFYFLNFFYEFIMINFKWMNVFFVGDGGDFFSTEQ